MAHSNLVTYREGNSGWCSSKYNKGDTVQSPGHTRTDWRMKNIAIEECGWHPFFFLATLRGMWDLVPWPGIEPVPPALEVQSLNHGTTREVPTSIFLSERLIAIGVSNAMDMDGRQFGEHHQELPRLKEPIIWKSLAFCIVSELII